MEEQSQDVSSKNVLEMFDTLPPREQESLRRILQGKHVARNTNKEFDETLTFGQHLADQVAAFGGSWTFIMNEHSLVTHTTSDLGCAICAPIAAGRP